MAIAVLLLGLCGAAAGWQHVPSTHTSFVLHAGLQVFSGLASAAVITTGCTSSQ